MALLKAFVVEDDVGDFLDFETLKIDTLNDYYSYTEYGEDINRLRNETMRLIHHSQNVIRGTIKVNEKKLLFLSIPYDPGWVMRIDGIKVQPKLINMGFMGTIVDKGSHSIELKFTPPYLLLGSFIMVISMIVYIFLILRSLRRKNFN